MNLRSPKLLALGLPALLAQCAPTGCAPTPGPAAPTGVTVTSIVDGDTIDVSNGERIRIIGIDAPEVGQCGATEATRQLRQVASVGTSVSLVPGARDDRDRYGRLLRYVDVAGMGDAGRLQIQSGFAIARYDSRDGYGAHAREADYIQVDAATPDFSCAPSTPPPPSSTYYANCDAVRAAGRAPLYAGQPGYEAPRLDRDGDGVACE